MASGIAALREMLGLSPRLIGGHSAGAAVGARMCLDGFAQPDVLVSLNGALLPIPALPTDLLGPVARLFAGSALTARALALVFGGEAAVQRLIRSGGSTIDLEGARVYARLAGSPAHVAGALRLMANWDLRPLAAACYTAGPDHRQQRRHGPAFRGSLVPRAELVSLAGLGHLAHEERPEQVAAMLLPEAAHEAAA